MSNQKPELSCLQLLVHGNKAAILNVFGGVTALHRALARNMAAEGFKKIIGVTQKSDICMYFICARGVSNSRGLKTEPGTRLLPSAVAIDTE
mgnify:FL=1